MDVTLALMSTARRVTVIAHELRGFHPAGGMGTATTFLALALARLGHSVEILLGKHAPAALDEQWQAVYRRAGIHIRAVPRPEEPVEPWHFDHTHRVALGLRDDPPDVVIAHDLGAPAYAALRLRQAGLAFEDTLFVVFCHGPRRYVLDLSPTVAVGDLHTVLGVSILEEASVGLADAVVSPSAYLLEWMRGRGWRLPERTRVIPYFTEASALDEPVSAAARPDPDPLRRLAFFGRVDEKKGVRILTAALNALEPELLRGLEVHFVGKTTRTWTRERAESLLSDGTTRALGGVVFETGLDQRQALARLSEPGTLVVMPSLQENSPNTVYECLERGIPFLASHVGGVPELIAAEERARVLFEPTPEALAGALRRALAEGRVPAPARPGFDPDAARAGWSDVVQERPTGRTLARGGLDGDVDVVANVEELGKGSAQYVLFLGADDVPADDLREPLARTMRATGADVVTCGVRLLHDDGTSVLRFFEGDPRGLGAIANGYGVAALIRRSALADVTPPRPHEGDASWPLLAALAAGGASIVSLPLALVERRASPGSAAHAPEAALLAVAQLEEALPDATRGAARIAAGLAARAHRAALERQAGAVDRAADILRRVTRRSTLRLPRGWRR